ncbi:MAG: PAS domain S-box protein [Verrucomicrobia bacterium]|nr:PAS domain S-box protein [Verrucomicrobiota bacterium]
MIAAALSASELRYRRLFEAAHDGILIVDPETRQIIDVNPFLVNFLGYAYKEFIGKELFEIGLLADEAASQAAFQVLQTTGYIRYEDLPLQTKDGRRVDVEFVSNLYQEGDQKVIQCTIRDISARRKAEVALSDAKDKRLRRTVELETLVGLRTAELLVSNAVKFVAAKTPQVRLRAEERPGGIVRIWVEDNGIGIPAEFQERVFHVFQRLHTTEYAGTGIGLAIVQKGIERMGGRAGLESAPRMGSRFWIELPKAPATVIELPPTKTTP